MPIYSFKNERTGEIVGLEYEMGKAPGFGCLSKRKPGGDRFRRVFEKENEVNASAQEWARKRTGRGLATEFQG